MDSKQIQINQMLSLIIDSCHPMPDYVFRYFVDHKKSFEEKCFYNLIADSFLSLFAYCKLMMENAWSQAFALLRVCIEQVAAVFILSYNCNALPKYIELNKLKIKFVNLVNDEEKKHFLKEHGITRNKVNDYFDYGWVSSFTEDKSFGRKQLMELAKLEEFIIDVDESLNAFAHGSISVFQMSGDNWNVMKRYGRRASLTCCKLYDFLCCSYHNLIGDEEFFKLPLDRYFKSFKLIYHDLFVTEGWIKND